jgi:hypothetical protein
LKNNKAGDLSFLLLKVTRMNHFKLSTLLITLLILVSCHKDNPESFTIDELYNTYLPDSECKQSYPNEGKLVSITGYTNILRISSDRISIYNNQNFSGTSFEILYPEGENLSSVLLEKMNQVTSGTCAVSVTGTLKYGCNCTNNSCFSTIQLNVGSANNITFSKIKE